MPHRTAPTLQSLDTPVRSIMRAGVITVPDDASIRQVQRALVAHRIHAVLVVGARSGEVVGWATAGGVLGRMDPDGSLLPATLAVAEPAEVISPTATVEEARRRLVDTGAARLLVCRADGWQPEGVISELDLIRVATPS